MQTKKGQSIEDASMKMIEDEIGSHNYNEKEWPIVRRIIHSTADFDFADKNRLIFQKDAIESGMNALKNGCSIVVDVNGVIGGLNKQNPKDFGNEIVCNISKPEIMQQAKDEGKTRSQVSMRVAKNDIDGGIVAIGNAPTALMEVIEMVNEGIVKPALIIGIPVGFICAPESKEELSKLQDSVPAAPFEQVKPIIEKDIGLINEKFDNIDPTSISGASLGQVYRGSISGQQIVIKVKRPGIEKVVEKDLKILKKILPLALRFVDSNLRYSAKTMLSQFIETIHEELDYTNESKNLKNI